MLGGFGEERKKAREQGRWPGFIILEAKSS